MCCGGLLPDIMHDVLEGALEYEVKLLLNTLLKDYFTLDNFNGWLENLELGYMECKSRPTQRKHYNHQKIPLNKAVCNNIMVFNVFM